MKYLVKTNAILIPFPTSKTCSLVVFFFVSWYDLQLYYRWFILNIENLFFILYLSSVAMKEMEC